MLFPLNFRSRSDSDGGYRGSRRLSAHVAVNEWLKWAARVPPYSSAF